MITDQEQREIVNYFGYSQIISDFTFQNINNLNTLLSLLPEGYILTKSQGCYVCYLPGLFPVESGITVSQESIQDAIQEALLKWVRRGKK